jgi:hypothetical protein
MADDRETAKMKAENMGADGQLRESRIPRQ